MFVLFNLFSESSLNAMQCYMFWHVWLFTHCHILYLLYSDLRFIISIWSIATLFLLPKAQYNIVNSTWTIPGSTLKCHLRVIVWNWVSQVDSPTYSTVVLTVYVQYTDSLSIQPYIDKLYHSTFSFIYTNSKFF